jgi:hypothetical protein
MLRSCRAFQACIRGFDDEPGFQPRDFAGQACELHRIEHGVEILLGGGRLVLRIEAAVREAAFRNFSPMGRSEATVQPLTAKAIEVKGR